MQNGMERQGLTAHDERAVDKIVEIDVLAVESDGVILEIIRIEEHVSLHQRKPKARTYAFLVGKTRLEVSDPLITGRRILELAGKNPPEKYTLRQVEHGGVLKVIELNDVVDLCEPGIERFRAMPRTASDG